MLYTGVRAALATKHGKEEAIAGPLSSLAGIDVVVARGIDTDALGTFTGEVERRGTMLETAVAKARLGMDALGLPFGIASEGSFGPHPLAPMVSIGYELLAFVDDVAGVTIREEHAESETNFSHLVVSPSDDLGPWLRQVGFPLHAIIVRPNAGDPRAITAKGVVDAAAIAAAVAVAARASADGRARLETDMRAHLNPTRMRSISRLARALARRLATSCPGCGAPGFGQSATVVGLPCRACGTPTEAARAVVWSCPRCDAREERPRPDGAQDADPGRCPRCNP